MPNMSMEQIYTATEEQRQTASAIATRIIEWQGYQETMTERADQAWKDGDRLQADRLWVVAKAYGARTAALDSLTYDLGLRYIVNEELARRHGA